jgi:hypothetical protein
MRARSIAAAGALVLMSAPLSGGVASVRAQTVEPTGTVRLASQTSWADTNRPFALRLQVAGVPRPDEAEVRVTVHARIGSRSQFARTIEGRSLGNVVTTTRATVAELLPTDAGGALNVVLGSPGLPLTRTGVYPVAVSLRETDGGDAIDAFVTHVVWVADALPDEAPDLGVALVLPVHAPPALRADGRSEPSDVDATALLADVLSDRRVPLTLAPTPETIDALSRAGAASAEALDELRAPPAGRQVLASTYVRVDLPALLQAGLDDLAGLERLTGAGTVARILDVRPDTRTWLDGGTLDGAAVRALRELQVDQVIVPERRLQPIDRKLTLAQPFSLAAPDGRPVDAAMADAALTAHFAARGDQVLAAHHLLADLVQLWLDVPQQERAVVAVAPDEWRPTRAFLEALLDGLADNPMLRGVTVDTLFRSIDPATTTRGRPLVRELAAREGIPTLPEDLIRSVEARLSALRSTLGAGDPALAALERRLLVAVSSDLSVRETRAHLTALDAAISDTLGQVELPRIRSFTLTAREGEIPITVLNRSDSAMNVLLRLASDRLELTGQDTLTLELPPRSTTVRIPVRARAPGEFPVRIELLSADGRLELASARFRVRSTAPSGVGVVLTASAGVFLALWWGRHMVRGRRARRLVPA